MARLLGVDIPNRKKIAYSLRYVYGIGPTRAQKKFLMIPELIPTEELRIYPSKI